MKKIALFFFISLALAACGDETLPPGTGISQTTTTTTTTPTTTNKAPASFTVTPTLQADNRTVLLSWTAAIDPDGDAVTYDIVLDGKTVITGLQGTIFSLAPLDYNVSKDGKVIAKDSKGLTTEATFKAVTKDKPTTGTTTPTTGDFVSIPDAVFEQELIDQKIDSDGIINGKIKAVDVAIVTKLKVSGFNKNKTISDLTGIESFAKLEYLSCTFNSLVTLNLKKNTQLTTLYCNSNNLSSLDISSNLKLAILDCSSNDITSLDVTKNILLGYLDLGDNYITSLDISKNLELTFLGCSANMSLKKLDITNNKKITKLDCNFTALSNLDISKNTALTEFSCNPANLKVLDTSKNSALKIMDIAFNDIAILDISNNINLTTFNCSENELKNLDISKNTLLSTFDCSNNLINIICVADEAKAIANAKWKKDATATYKKCN